MRKVAKNLIELVGNTPLMEVNNYKAQKALDVDLIVKIESFNPLSSVKDRIAVGMIEDAERRGLLKKGYTIVEPTSGNTGIGLAAVAAAKKYKIILTMPETMSIERRRLLKALGAEVILTKGTEGMKGAIKKAEELVKEMSCAFMPSQFQNASNPRKHKHTTALEILTDTEWHVDIFIAGVGTGGTITGVGRILKTYNPDIQIIAVEPEGSPFLSCGEVGPHKIQGIGAGFKPAILEEDVIDEIIAVSDTDAIAESRAIAKLEGILVGISSGAALYAATQIAMREENKGKTVVVLLPDTGERYLSTGLYD